MMPGAAPVASTPISATLHMAPAAAPGGNNAGPLVSSRILNKALVGGGLISAALFFALRLWGSR